MEDTSPAPQNRSKRSSLFAINCTGDLFLQAQPVPILIKMVNHLEDYQNCSLNNLGNQTPVLFWIFFGCRHRLNNATLVSFLAHDEPVKVRNG